MGIFDTAAKAFGISNKKEVPTTTRETRLFICQKTCKEYEPWLKQCGNCHCLVERKTWYEEERCPLGKW